MKLANERQVQRGRCIGLDLRGVSYREANRILDLALERLRREERVREIEKKAITVGSRVRAYGNTGMVRSVCMNGKVCVLWDRPVGRGKGVKITCITPKNIDVIER
jgi:hypothetical protein